MNKPVVVEYKKGKIKIGPFFFNTCSSIAFVISCSRLLDQKSYRDKHKDELKKFGIKYIKFNVYNKKRKKMIIKKIRIDYYFSYLENRWENKRKKRGGK